MSEAETQEEARDYESEARAQGWVDQDEFKDDPKKHKTAQEFVEFGEGKAAMNRVNVRRLSEKVASLEQSMDYQVQHSEQMLKDQNDRLRAEYETKKREAVKEGDTEAYDEANTAQEAIKDPIPVPAVQQEPPEIVQFRTDQRWYDSDSAMRVVADAESQRLLRINPNMDLQDNLDRVLEHVQENFPHKFQRATNPNRDETPAVGAGKPASKGGGKAFAQLPQDAQEAWARFHKDGVFGKDTSEADSKKQYLSTYKWD